MNSLFGDATTVAPTPETLAEAESLFSGRSPVPSFRLNDDAEGQVPDLDIEAIASNNELNRTVLRRKPERSYSEGVGGWISNIVRKSKGDHDSVGKTGGQYKKLDDDDEE